MTESQISIPAGPNREYVKTIRVNVDGKEVNIPVVAVEAAATSYEVNPSTGAIGFVTVSAASPREEVFPTACRETDIFVKDQDVYVEIDTGNGDGYQGKFVLPASLGLVIYAVPDRVKAIRFTNVDADGSHNALYQVKGSV
ncbi:MAG: hypothetical protein PHP59_10215 [Methanofollis sp.]|uniref:hypothetical protein n=1 Tax=Methanofollis sp. TaxID=2052835 RepID=UPI00262B82F0|nr:hypothetical protein [Methanofollis sp.]MDD4255731.1 hypothetical protein [Methanofollis sp.]